MSSAVRYFDGDCLTDDAILTTELLRQCSISSTPPRSLPKTLNMKDLDMFDYYTKNLKITYPSSGSSTTVIIPNVVLHCETFDQYGKTGVYVGVPQQFVEQLRIKLISNKMRPIFEDPALSSDDKYWWTRCGFLPAEEDKEYICIVEDDDDGIGLAENMYPSFQELFVDVGSSVIANVTCSIKMNTKIEVTRKGSITADDEWRMGLNVTRVNVIDLIDIDKPKNSVPQKSMAGKKDKAKSRLLQRIRDRQGNKIA